MLSNFPIAFITLRTQGSNHEPSVYNIDNILPNFSFFKSVENSQTCISIASLRHQRAFLWPGGTLITWAKSLIKFFWFLGHILMVRSPYNCSLTLFLTVKIMKMIFVICCLDMRAVLPKPSRILAYIAKWHQNALGLLEAPYLHNFVNILCITDSFMPFDAVFGSSVELCSFEIMCNYYSD